MRAKAIVIGIDHYAVADWRLDGAVRDALAFARWAVGAGGVAPADLALLLAPRPEAPPDTTGLGAAIAPTREQLLKVLQAFKLRAAGQGADRLYFFYAGHGLSAPGASPSSGPLLVPCDTEDAELYIDGGPIGMEDFRNAMQDQPPGEQLYFVDACRDALPVRGAHVLAQSRFWSVGKIESGDLATQGVLLATTAGERAKEIRGRGVFSKLLVKALQGIGPKLDAPVAYAPAGARLRLAFPRLFPFVKAAIAEELGAENLQVPYEATNKGGDLTLAEFGAGELPLVNLTIFVDPAEARPTGRIEFMEWSDPHARFEARLQDPAPASPPLAAQVDLRSTGGSHVVRVSSDGFEELILPVLLYEDRRIPAELRPRPVAREAIGFEGVKSRAVDAGLDWIKSRVVETGLDWILSHAADPGLTSPLDRSGRGGERRGSKAGERGALHVSAADRLTRLAIHDGGGRELIRGYHRIQRKDLAPGLYRVTAELAGSDRIESHVVVESGPPRRVVLEVPAPARGAGCRAVIDAIGIPAARSPEVSEAFGPVGALRMGSLLAYAAWAARWPQEASFERLRAIAIDPLPQLAPDACAIQVIVADLDAPDLPPGAVRVVRERAPATAPPIEPALSLLPGLAFAAQAAVAIEPGGAFVRVADTTLAVCAVPGFVTVVVATRERGEPLVLEHYLAPIDPLRPAAPGLAAPQRDDVRRIELSWRALDDGEPADAIEYQDLLDGTRANPLLSVIAGYRMWNTPRAAEFAAGPLADLVRWFPAIPDVHVLAGLYDAAHRDDHHERAASIGTPLTSAGFQALTEWLARRATRDDRVPLELRRRLVPGAAWTTWTSDVAPAAPGQAALRIITPTGRPYRDRTPLAAVGEIASRIGWLEVGDTRASCVILNAKQIVCPRFAIESLAAPGSTARLRLDGPASPALAIARDLGPIAPPPAGAPRALWPHVLELAAELARPLAELRVDGAAPRIGQRVAVIGFPRFEPVELAFANHFAAVDEIRHAMIGNVLAPASDGFTFEYDGCAAPGADGGLIIDLERGSALGIHAGARRDAAGNRRSFGLAISAFAEALVRRGRITTDEVAA